MIATRTVRMEQQLGDRSFTLEATAVWDDDANELPSNLVLNHETYYTGDIQVMLRQLGDLVTTMQNALNVSADDEVAA